MSICKASSRVVGVRDSPQIRLPPGSFTLGMEMKSLVRAVRRVSADAAFFASPADVLKSAWASSLRGRPGRFLPGRGRVVTVRVAGFREPFAARLGSADFGTLRSLFLDREYAKLDALVGAVPATVIDLGANVGYSIRLWASLFPGCRTVAVEPDPGNAVICRLNARLGGISDRVRLIRACAAASPGHRTLSRGGEEDSYTIASVPSGRAIEVRAVTVDDIISRHFAGLEIDLLKCDVEGAEYELFAYCTGWIKRVRLIVVELHGGLSSGQLLSVIAHSGGSFEEVALVEKGGGLSLGFFRNTQDRRRG